MTTETTTTERTPKQLGILAVEAMGRDRVALACGITKGLATRWGKGTSTPAEAHLPQLRGLIQTHEQDAQAYREAQEGKKGADGVGGDDPPGEGSKAGASFTQDPGYPLDEDGNPKRKLTSDEQRALVQVTKGEYYIATVHWMEICSDGSAERHTEHFVVWTTDTKAAEDEAKEYAHDIWGEEPDGLELELGSPQNADRAKSLYLRGYAEDSEPMGTIRYVGELQRDGKPDNPPSGESSSSVPVPPAPEGGSSTEEGRLADIVIELTTARDRHLAVMQDEDASPGKLKQAQIRALAFNEALAIVKRSSPGPLFDGTNS